MKQRVILLPALVALTPAFLSADIPKSTADVPPAVSSAVRAGDLGLPVLEGLETPLQQPFRLVLLGGDPADDIFIQAGGCGIGVDVRNPAVLVLLDGRAFDLLVAGTPYLFQSGQKVTPSRC